MRELKFRVWSEEDKEYRSDIKVSDLVVDIDGVPSTIYNDEGDRFDIEQYTGLKDKNGKEIYEGDIIREKWFDEDARRGENRVGKCEYFTDGFVCWFVGGRFIQLGMLVSSHIEVIGNIHENPELLEKDNAKN